MPDPQEPGPGEVVLEVTRAAICGTDSAEWEHGPLLTRPPVVLGHEFTGRAIAVGDGVSGIRIGDRVVSGAGVSCGECAWCHAERTNLCAHYYTLGLQVDGGLAEFVSSPAKICQIVPDTVSDDAAAMAQPLAVALHAVQRSRLNAGDTCVVVGVGGIGAFVVAGAAARQPGRLIAIDLDDERLATARALGAHQTVNVAGKDLAQAILAATDGDGAHVVLEASGAPQGPAAALRGARRGGRVVLIGLQSAPRELDLFDATLREVEIATTVAHVCTSDLPESLGILATSPVAETVLDRVIPLDRLVDDGIRALSERTARGKIVVDPGGA